MKFRLIAFASILALGALPAAAADWSAVGAALGKTGTVQAGDVYRVGLPRTDLKVSLDGVAIKPTLALGSWVAFHDAGGHTMVMGDLVLTQEEVNPVMSALIENGFTITALHNHLLRASPATMYMHIDGYGDAVKLATALHAALAKSGTPLGANPPPAPPAPLDLDQAAVERALGGFKGTVNGGVLQFNVPRAETPKAGGMVVPTAMGSAIAINFQPTGGGKAAITGDFVLTADEVNPVIKALRSNGIEVTALHNHMLDDEPRLFFMHFWANDDAGKLARGLRAALNQVKIGKPG